MPTAQRPSQCCSNPVIPLPLAASTENALIAQFKALGDPTRFGILRLIAAQRDPICACDIVARFGGEEFVILLPDVEMQDALTIIQRIQNNLTKSFSIQSDSQTLPITFSAGVALRSFGEHQNSVLSRADKALYQAKRTGKNRAIPALI